MRRSLIAFLSNSMFVIFLVGIPLMAQGRAPMENKAKGMANGIKVIFFTAEGSLEAEQGEDVFGVHIFKVLKKKNGKSFVVSPSEGTKKKIIKFMKKIQGLTYQLKFDRALWAFDGDSFRVEIRNGVRQLSYEDLIENAPNKEIILKLLDALWKE